MIPSVKIEKMYHNGTSFTIIDSSCDVTQNPDKIIFSIGNFKKDKVNITLDDNSYVTPYQFINGTSIMINSYILGITKQEDKLLEIESGLIEIQYYSFFNTTVIAEVNRNRIILDVPHYTITSNYDYILIDNKIYYIAKAQCFDNVIILTTDTEKIGSFQIYSGKLGINYIVHTIQIKNKLISLIGDNIPSLLNKDVNNCSKNEISFKSEIVNYLLLWYSINILKQRNKLFELNLVIDTLKNNLFNIKVDTSIINSQSNGSSCNFCN